MKIIIFYKQGFLDWPNDIIKKIKQNNEALEIIAIASNTHVYNKLKNNTELCFSGIYDLEPAEKKWLGEAPDLDELKEIEKTLGKDTLLKTIAADKILGQGWINGASFVDMELEKSIQNQEMLQAYITGLYKWLFSIFEAHRPDLLFMATVASGIPYAMASVSQHFDCKVRRFQHSRINDIYILDSSKESLLEPVNNLTEQAALNPELISSHKPKAVEWLNTYRAEKVEEASNLKMVNTTLSNYEKWPVIFKKLLGILYRTTKAFLRKGQPSLRKKPEKQNFVNNVIVPIKRRYGFEDKHFESFSKYENKDYVYFTLGTDPEASTLVTAPYTVNQLAVIEALSKTIPLSMTLLVKEHPIMLGRRPKGYYKTIRSMPNVALIHPCESSRELIKKAQLVTTITGTVGWEAMLLERPVLLFGQAPYMAVKEGYVYCDSYVRLSEKLDEALSSKIASDEAITRYIASIMKLGISIPDAIIWKFETRHLKEHRKVTEHVAEEILSIAQVDK